VRNLINAIYDEQQANRLKEEKDNRTIILNALDVSVTDFDITDEKKSKLIYAAKESTMNHFNEILREKIGRGPVI